MRVFKLIFKNAWRHPLRSALTILGMAIAVMAFSMIRTSIDGWYSSAEASSPRRLVTSNSVSIIFPLPLAYRQRIEKVPGVKLVGVGNWFGGVYIEPKNFFPKFAVDHMTFFDLYPEYIVVAQEKERFLAERNAVLVGRKLADRFSWKVGDRVQITGDIFPGQWDFVVCGIYTGAEDITDESSFYFRWDYLDERMRVEAPMRAGDAGWFTLLIDDPTRAAAIGQAIDTQFVNSLAATKTQTEKAFTLGFIEQASTIIAGLKIVSVLVIGIIFLVLANTMAMTARERIREYAVLKTLGFGRVHIIGLIFGESMTIAVLGGLCGVLLTYPIVSLMGQMMADFFPVFKLGTLTIIFACISAVVVGLLAAVFPAIKALKTSIVDGLRLID